MSRPIDVSTIIFKLWLLGLTENKQIFEVIDGPELETMSTSTDGEMCKLTYRPSTNVTSDGPMFESMFEP